MVNADKTLMSALGRKATIGQDQEFSRFMSAFGQKRTFGSSILFGRAIVCGLESDQARSPIYAALITSFRRFPARWPVPAPAASA
jgi:hypothetical protein